MLIDLRKENGFTLKEKRKYRQYPKGTITDADYTDDLVLFTNTAAQAKSQLHSPKQATGGIGLYVNANKTEFMCFK